MWVCTDKSHEQIIIENEYLIKYQNICHYQLIWQLWPFENLKSKQFPYDEKVKLGNIKSYLFNQRLQL